jgi:hypothetical protein
MNWAYIYNIYRIWFTKKTEFGLFKEMDHWSIFLPSVAYNFAKLTEN